MITVSEILADAALRAREFPVTRDRIFLGHAAVCPLPARVVRAITEYSQQASANDQEQFIIAEITARVRDLAARALGAKPDEIALVGPTSLGLNYVAQGLPWKRHNNVIAYFDDYPSNVYPWMALAARGVQVRFIRTRRLGQIEPIHVFEQVDENTRLVALASAHFISGYRPDLAAIGEYLHRRKIRFCVDGIQTLGAYPADLAHIDFLAADAHKWVLGPCGAGILYVAAAQQEHLVPPFYGWNNVRCPQYVAQEQMILRAGARRYEVGTTNLLGLVGLAAALDLLLELGIANIAAELSRKRQWLVPALESKGYQVLASEVPAERASSIISITRVAADMAAAHQRLAEANIVTSLRADRTGTKYIRLSPHFYNTDAELQRTLDLL